ncbi:hypothetical protein FHS07_001546 [Microbacterium proteolyticum]|uniref:SHOCT domain-containing protein n=1 Tax=Microbacterium proteolyticum TaxID=1572644 RepID=A0A7W5CHP4_9MICO|nr:hypothetical protein [Microbacterium proteolyticum]
MSGRSARKNATAAPAPAVSPAAGKALPSDDAIAKIERLAALHTAGALTDEEFTELKSRALN